MKIYKKIKTSLVLSSIVGLAIPMVSCYHEPDKPPKATKSILNKNGKVNYVTLGDSLSAGFTGMMDKQYNYIDYQAADHADATHTIYGDAYSAWVARGLQKENLLGSYDNFAVASQTTGQVIHQIDPSYPQNSDDKDHYNTFTDNGKFDAWITKSDWDNYYNNSDVIKTAIKKADLVTITMGGNDIIYLCKFFGYSTEYLKEHMATTVPFILHDILSKKYDWGKAVSYDQAKFNLAVLHLKNNIAYIINQIHKINYNAKIMFLGYSFTIGQLRNNLDMAQKETGKSDLEYILNTLNSTIKSQTTKFDYVDYVATDNFAKQTSKKLTIDVPTPSGSTFKVEKPLNAASWYTPIFGDVHPGPYGYRYIASDIITALMGDNSSNINPDPNLPLTDDSETRLPANSAMKELELELLDYNADLSTFLINPSILKSVAYLQPSIAQEDSETPTSSIDPKVQKKIGEENDVLLLLSGHNNTLWDAKTAATTLANKAVDPSDSAAVVTFKNKYKNITAANVGIQEYRDYKNLKLVY